eukprot:scaffold7468_cov277-Pinguiococcus_pyrenoidosus.AAC.5
MILLRAWIKSQSCPILESGNARRGRWQGWLGTRIAHASEKRTSDVASDKPYGSTLASRALLFPGTAVPHPKNLLVANDVAMPPRSPQTDSRLRFEFAQLQGVPCQRQERQWEDLKEASAQGQGRDANLAHAEPSSVALAKRIAEHPRRNLDGQGAIPAKGLPKIGP